MFLEYYSADEAPSQWRSEQAWIPASAGMTDGTFLNRYNGTLIRENS
jgi:hypothetical protein